MIYRYIDIQIYRYIHMYIYIYIHIHASGIFRLSLSLLLNYIPHGCSIWTCIQYRLHHRMKGSHRTLKAIESNQILTPKIIGKCADVGSSSHAWRYKILHGAFCPTQIPTSQEVRITEVMETGEPWLGAMRVYHGFLYSQTKRSLRFPVLSWFVIFSRGWCDWLSLPITSTAVNFASTARRWWATTRLRWGWAKTIPTYIHPVDGRNPAPPGMVRTL